MPPVVVNPTDPCANAATMANQYLQAESDLLTGKKVQWGDRILSREDLKEIRAGRMEWEARYRSCIECQQGNTRPRLGGLGVSFGNINQEDGGSNRGC